MTCPRCGNQNVNVQLVQMGARTSTKKKGCLYGIARFLLICCTGGLWLLFGKKKATSKTVFAHAKQAVCSNCGHSWTIGAANTP